MRSDLERRLREALHEDAQRARLVSPHGPPAPEERLLTVEQHRRSSTRRLVAAAAAVALVVAAGVAVTQTREPDLTAEDPVATVTTHLSVDVPAVFTDIPPGSTVELPPGPISQRDIPAVVWTGTEMIVWSGMTAGDATLDDGAAFDLATGTWRVIAPAPIEPRIGAAAAWTGTEMVVWGGQTQWANGAGLVDGAAYNPTTDTWRRLPEGPFDSWQAGGRAVWTGDELVVAGIEADQREERYPMAAYDPAANEWRRLADAPPFFEFDLLWTGEAILTAVPGSYSTATGEFGPSQVMRYDLGSDAWQPVEELASDDVSLIAVPDADGAARVVLALAHDTGTPLVVLDPSGEAIGTVPAIPADAAKVGDRHASGGVGVGEEVLFWIRSFESEGPPERWALNLETQTWRPLEADHAPPVYFDLQLVPEAGVLIGWSAVAEPDGPSTGIVYRPPTPVGD